MKKLTLAAFVAAILLAPVRSAVAWDWACVTLPFGMGYAGNFWVIHDFPEENGLLPGIINNPSINQAYHHSEPNEPVYVRSALHDKNNADLKNAFNHAKIATGAEKSGHLTVTRTECVNIEAIAAGQPFFLVFWVDDKEYGSNLAYCYPVGDFQELKWQRQRKSGPSTLFFQATGSVFNPTCAFWKEA